MRIISISGPKGAGKDTAADILIENKKLDGKISFAGPLKEICMEVFNLHFNLINDPDLKEAPLKEPIQLTRKLLRELKHAGTAMLDPEKYGYNPNRASVVGLEGMVFKTPREILQVIGTEFFRMQMHQDWHLMAAFSEERLAKLKGSNFAVTDARFPNEYQFLKNKFGAAFAGYYIERQEAEARLANATHESELGVIEVRKLVGEDNVISNNSSKEEFKKKLLKIELPGSTYSYGIDLGTDGYSVSASGRKFKFGNQR